MTRTELITRLEGAPFARIRLHRRQGRSLKINVPNRAYVLTDRLLILKGPPAGHRITGYDIIPLDNIDLIEDLPS